MVEAIKMRDAHRMADELRTQSHDEGNARISEDVHGTRAGEDPQRGDL
jgi:hypothetical protein